MEGQRDLSKIAAKRQCVTMIFFNTLQSKLNLIIQRSKSIMLFLTFFQVCLFFFAESAYAPSMPISKALTDDSQSGEKGQERD